MPYQGAVVYERKPGSGRGTYKQRERVIQVAIARHMRRNYPEADFFNDWASGAYLTAGQNKARLAMASNNGWVDLLILEPRRGFSALFIEIKKEGTKIYLKDGKTLVADKQLRKEAAFLARQRTKGIWASFGVGLEDCIDKIDRYFGKPVTQELF